MKKIAGLFSLFVGICFFGGCAVVAPPSQVVVAQPPDVAELDYVGETTPLVVAAYPSVAFYPRYVDGVIVPVAFVGGVWINERGARIVHEGGWRHPPPHVTAAHREKMRAHPNMYHRMNNPPRRPLETKLPQNQQVRPQQARPPQQKAPPPAKVPVKKAPEKKCPKGQDKC